MRSVPETHLTWLPHRKVERFACEDTAGTRPDRTCAVNDSDDASNDNDCTDNRTQKKNDSRIICSWPQRRRSTRKN